MLKYSWARNLEFQSIYPFRLVLNPLLGAQLGDMAYSSQIRRLFTTELSIPLASLTSHFNINMFNCLALLVAVRSVRLIRSSRSLSVPTHLRHIAEEQLVMKGYRTL